MCCASTAAAFFTLATAAPLFSARRAALAVATAPSNWSENASATAAFSTSLGWCPSRAQHMATDVFATPARNFSGMWST